MKSQLKKPKLKSGRKKKSPITLAKEKADKALPHIKTIHIIVRGKFPSPNGCPKCKRKVPLELSSKHHKYTLNKSDYQWLCRSCHMKYDYKYNNRTKGTLGRIVTRQTREKLSVIMSEKMRGVKKTKIHRQNLSLSHKGQIPWNKGIKQNDYGKKT